jgi:hypothetical protein
MPSLRKNKIPRVSQGWRVRDIADRNTIRAIVVTQKAH